MKQTTQTVITILNPNFNSPPTKKHNFPATNVDLRWRSRRILSITSVAIFNFLNDLVRLCLFLDRLYLQNPPFSGLFLIFTSIHIILHNLCTLFYNFVYQWWWTIELVYQWMLLIWELFLLVLNSLLLFDFDPFGFIYMQTEKMNFSIL
jgi:hypothetical protein